MNKLNKELIAKMSKGTGIWQKMVITLGVIQFQKNTLAQIVNHILTMI